MLNASTVAPRLIEDCARRHSVRNIDSLAGKRSFPKRQRAHVTVSASDVGKFNPALVEIRVLPDEVEREAQKAFLPAQSISLADMLAARNNPLGVLVEVDEAKWFIPITHPSQAESLERIAHGERQLLASKADQIVAMLTGDAQHVSVTMMRKQRAVEDWSAAEVEL